MSKTKRVNFTSRLLTCQDIRLKNAPTKWAQLHILKNLLFIKCISSHESCQVFGDPCMSNWPHLQMQPDLCSNPRTFPRAHKPSILVPAFSPSPRGAKSLMMKNQNVEIKMPHLDVPGIFCKGLYSTWGSHFTYFVLKGIFLRLFPPISIFFTTFLKHPVALQASSWAILKLKIRTPQRFPLSLLRRKFQNIDKLISVKFHRRQLYHVLYHLLGECGSS